MTDEYEHEPFLRGGKLDVVWTDSTLPHNLKELVLTRLNQAG
jgi:hypothetical protein